MNQQQVIQNLAKYSWQALDNIADQLDYQLYSQFLQGGTINTKLLAFMDTVQQAISEKILYDK